MDISINGTGLVRFSSIDRISDDARRAQQDGFESYWLAEHPVGGFDALTVLSSVAQRVPEMHFGTAIVPTWPRHPMALAQQALTSAQVMSAGLTLGIGLSHASMLAQLGISMTKPIRHLKEYLSILMPLLDEGRVSFEGELLSCNAELFVTPESRPVVLVAALGPQALNVTGRLADGTILAWVGEKTIREHIVPTIRSSASEAGKKTPKIVATLPVCVTDDKAATYERARKTFSMYNDLPSYRAMLEREGVNEAAELVITGSRAEVEDRLHGLADAGLDHFAASEFPRDDDEARRTRELLRSMVS